MQGVLALNIPVPGLRRRVLLTKIMEWNLRYCLLDPMFDKNFQIRPSFKVRVYERVPLLQATTIDESLRIHSETCSNSLLQYTGSHS